MHMEFSYDLIGIGWAECTLRVGDQEATTTAEDRSDALGELASATAGALRGDPCSIASFFDEPGEYRWILEPRPNGQVRIRTLKFPEPEPGEKRPVEEGLVYLDVECDLRTFAGAVVSELERLKEKYGEEGYRDKWGKHDFPGERLGEIQGLLDKHQ